MKILAKTLYGLEDVLAAELEALGAQQVSIGNRAVFFEGNLESLYKMNICSRLALRFLKPIEHFKARNEDQLYDAVSKIPWSKIFSVDQSFAIDSTVYGETFTHSHYVSLKVKDAIVDRFRKETNKRPNINTQEPDVRINVHISHQNVNLSLDSSGVSLEKRGYRTEANEAPMSEVLAAGILALSGWNGTSPLLDPMTGSGTIAIEAALMSTNTPPGVHRQFAFMEWPDFDEDLFEKVEYEARNAITEPTAEIYARDKTSVAIMIAKRNADRAGVLQNIRFERRDFLRSEPAFNEGVIVINPPYGERMTDDRDPSMDSLYEQIGAHLKHHFPKHEAWVYSANVPALGKLGFKPKKKVKLFNGPLEGRLDGFDIFAGKLHEQK